MRKLTATMFVVLMSLMFVSEIIAQTTAYVGWRCVPPDSQKVSTTQGALEGFSQIGSPGFVVRSYSGSAEGPLGTNQRWWPYSDGKAVSWGNETEQVDSRYVQFSVKPTTGSNFHVDNFSVYLGGGGTSHIRANIAYSKKADFSEPVQLNSSKLILGNNSDTLYTFQINSDILEGDTLFIRIYPWYEGSPSSSKYLYIQDAKITGTTKAVTFPASASWPITNPADGGTGFSSITNGQVVAEDEFFMNTEINQYSGPNNSQRIRMAGTGNTWPAGLTDQIDSVYVQFAVSPKGGYTFYVNSLSIDIGAKSSSTFKANLWYSTDPTFTNATKLSYTTSDASGNNYLNSNNLESFSFTLDEVVNSGQTFYFRVYPWNQDASIKSGKYLCIQNVVVSGEVEGNPMHASISWNTELTNVPVISGDLLGQNESYSNKLYLFDHVKTYLDSHNQAVATARITTSTQPIGSWNASEAPLDDFYVQYAVMPKYGGTFFVDSVSLNLGSEFTENLKAAVYFTKSSSLATKTLLIPATDLMNGTVVNMGAKLNAEVKTGETFYLRIYPYNKSNESSWRRLLVNNVQIIGTTIGIVSDPPTVTTSNVLDISTTFAKSGGNVATDGGSPVIAKGVCWNETGMPTVTDSKTEDGSGSGTFNSVLTNLTPGTKYFIRAYATNAAGTSYGIEETFITLDSTMVPTVETGPITNILVKTAQAGGNVLAWGGDTVTVRGVCWNKTGNPTISDNKTENGDGLGLFTSIMHPLEEGTTYYVRAYATNSKGTGYGLVDTFKTQIKAPTITKVVAADGSGDYISVQSAFNDVPDLYTGAYYIYIKNGTYYEKLLLPSTKTNVILVGEDRDKTILTYDDYAGKNNLGTSGSYSVAIDADDFSAYNITFQNTIVNDNSHPGGNEQAVALRVNGDRQQYYNCNLLGYQDTYYTWGGRGTGRTYMKNCYIEGSVDFIFGRNIVVFDSCHLNINRNGGAITAASTEATSKFGYVFLNNKITTDSIGFDGVPITSFILGRPWQASPRTVFINCEEPASLNPAGWATWNVTPGLYAEYNCFGPGSDFSNRLTSISRQLSAEEAAEYTIQNVFSKSSSPNFGYDWMPDFSIFTSINEEKSNEIAPDTYELNQNYPNPFNPTTTIKYSIPKAAHVKISIYNILGEKVAALIDSEQSAGRYEINFNASSLASGVYFYNIQAGDFIQTKKMLLLK